MNDVSTQSHHQRHTEYLTPRLSIPDAPSMDICFVMVESKELREFVGTWRIQTLDRKTTVLTYTVKVSPKPWLPTNLVETRISKEVRVNLNAVRTFTEAKVYRD